MLQALEKKLAANFRGPPGTYYLLKNATPKRRAITQAYDRSFRLHHDDEVGENKIPFEKKFVVSAWPKMQHAPYQEGGTSMLSAACWNRQCFLVFKLELLEK